MAIPRFNRPHLEVPNISYIDLKIFKKLQRHFAIELDLDHRIYHYGQDLSCYVSDRYNILDYDHANYIGKWMQGDPEDSFDKTRHGYGKMIYDDGSIYEGEWDNDCREYGCMTYANGNIYIGPFHIGRRLNYDSNIPNTYLGIPIELYKTDYYSGDNWAPHNYTGSLKNNMRHGYGVMRYDDGYVYRGTWENDKRSGIGKLAYINDIDKDYSTSSPDIYYGPWYDDKRISSTT